MLTGDCDAVLRYLALNVPKLPLRRARGGKGKVGVLPGNVADLPWRGQTWEEGWVIFEASCGFLWLSGICCG